MARIDDAPTAIVVQFVTTFGVWLVAEHFELSGVVTIVVFGLTASRREARSMTVYIRIPSFATWQCVTFVLNVLAFTLIGLQVLPILEGLRGTNLLHQQRLRTIIVGMSAQAPFVWS